MNKIIQTAVSSNTLLYTIWFYVVRIRKGSRVKLPGKCDDLYFDGYPRSGNTFFAGLMERLYPNIKYSSHLHSIAGIKIAFGRKIPVFILIRYPADAIISNVFRISRAKGLSVNQKLVDDMTWGYLKYYDFVLKNRSRLNILNFTELVNDKRLLMNKLSNTLGLKKYSKEKLDNIIERNQEIMKNQEENKEVHVSSMENKKRKKFKVKYIDLVYSSKHFDGALLVYDKLSS